MQTRLPASLMETIVGREADAILRRCVHCGFCNATCPTFRLTGNELEGPRGRIYLIKNLLEGERPTGRTLAHLDHCLGCRACETTCPSGVEFHRLADIGRETATGPHLRTWWDRWRRRLIARFFDDSLPLRWSLTAGRALRGLMPARFARLLPAGPALPAPRIDADRHVLILEGCVQPSLAPSINRSAARVLGRRGIGTRSARGCCGALAYHLDEVDRARAQIRRNIDAWLPGLEGGEGLVVTASGCAAFIKDYPALCRDEPDYAKGAARVADSVRDVCGFLEPMKEAPPEVPEMALHIPCTLRNALGGETRLRGLLRDSGWSLVETADDGQCCGSAGAYSLLHRRTSAHLRSEKLARLRTGKAGRIVTANIGCLVHLAAGSEVPVRHWVEVWDELESRQ